AVRDAVREPPADPRRAPPEAAPLRGVARDEAFHLGARVMAMLRSERARVRLFVVVAWLLYGLLLFGYKHLDHVARAVPIPAIVPFLEGMTGVLSALVLFAPFVAFVRRFPIRRATWWRYVPLHVIAAFVISFVHTWMMARSRALVFPLLGLGEY